jgi:2'-5' RNA ligase
MMQTIRSFVAIELSAEARTALIQLQNQLKALAPRQTVRWAAPESLHLTLHFLGDVPADDIDKITQLLHEAASASSPFTLALGGLGCFPNTRRPRIIWTGVLGETQSLQQLHLTLGEKLKAIGFTPETRPYSPHLTLGRVINYLPTRQLTKLGQAIEQAQGQVGQLASLRVTQISLMKSELKSGGAVYTQLVSAILKNP